MGNVAEVERLWVDGNLVLNLCVGQHTESTLPQGKIHVPRGRDGRVGSPKTAFRGCSGHE